MASPQEITDFLKKFKLVLLQDFTFIKRKKNLDTVSRLGITIPYVKTLFAQLTYKDYINGPEKDKDRHGNMIWEFGIHIQGEEIYIKLSDDFSFNKAKCISFHIADFPIKYPYKTS